MKKEMRAEKMIKLSEIAYDLAEALEQFDDDMAERLYGELQEEWLLEEEWT